MWSVLIYSKNSHFQFQNFFSHDTNAFDNWFPCIQSDNCTCSHPNYCWCMCHHFDIGWGWECTARLQLLGVKLWKLNLAKVFSSTNYFHFFHFKLIFWQNNFTKKSLFGSSRVKSDSAKKTFLDDKVIESDWNLVSNLIFYPFDNWCP